MCTDKPLKKEQHILVRCQYQSQNPIMTAQWLRAGVPNPSTEQYWSGLRNWLHSGDEQQVSNWSFFACPCRSPSPHYCLHSASLSDLWWHILYIAITAGAWGWDSVGSFTPFKSSDRLQLREAHTLKGRKSLSTLCDFFILIV